jgi:hypothetical protein
MHKLLIVTCLLLSVLLAGCSSDKVFRGSVRFDNQATSPKGVRVYGDRKASAEKLRAIDAGLDTAFDIAAGAYGYTGFSTHADYSVILRPRSSLCNDPGFLVDGTGSPYDGSKWDKDPDEGEILLCAAGLQFRRGAVIPGSSIGGPAMLIVDDLEVMHNAAWFEAEHNLLLEVDPEKFNRTQYHTDGGHPINPDTRAGAKREAWALESDLIE